MNLTKTTIQEHFEKFAAKIPQLHLQKKDNGGWTGSAKDIKYATKKSSLYRLMLANKDSKTEDYLDTLAAGTPDLCLNALGYSRWIQLNREAKGNALTLVMIKTMFDAMKMLQKNENCSNIIILSGLNLDKEEGERQQGKIPKFCTGGDIVGKHLLGVYRLSDL